MATVPPRPDRPAGRDPEWAELPAPTWRALEAIPVFLLVLVLSGVIGLPLQSLVDSCSGRFIVGNLTGAVAFLVATLFWIRQVAGGSLAALGLPRRPLRDIVVGLVFGAVLVVLATATAEATAEVVTAFLGHPPPEAEQVDPCVRGASLILLGPLVILGAPLGEETFFRGFLFRGLRRRFRFWPAALISGAVFGALHVVPLSARQAAGTAVIAPALFVVGVGLAMVYERRKSLLAPIIAHVVFNIVGFLGIALTRA
jgi:membrane protease YdiL (CAAX protease family)